MLYRSTMNDASAPIPTKLIVGAVLVAAAIGAIVSTQVALSQAPAGDQSLKGKNIMITGSTDGLGREVARRVAALGAHVIVHGRNQERGQALVDEITKEGKGSAKFYAADLASLDDVRTLAAAILRDYNRLDVLVNNAGISLVGDRQVSKDGHELHFAVNYLSGFLLTRTLLPRIVDSAPSRIINVSSLAQSPIDFDDLMLEQPGRSAQGYGHSKLAQILFTNDLAEELKDKNVIVTSLHPATLMNTSMVQRNNKTPRSDVSEGTEAVMQQIVGDVTSGTFYNGKRVGRPNAQANDAEVRAKLKKVSMELTGLKAGQ